MEDQRPVQQHAAMTDRLQKQLLVLSAVSLLSLGVSACGGTSHASRPATTSTTASSEANPEERPLDADHDTDVGKKDEDGSALPIPPEVDRDNDHDTSVHTRYDSDDKSILDFGHAADPADKQQITALVRRYYAASAAEDGTTACSMIYSPYAESIPEDYGTSPPGPKFARGNTCAEVMTKVFKHFHEGVAQRYPLLKISRVRVKGRVGIAILSFGPKLSEREIHLEKEGHAWKALALIEKDL